jgi:hypothetical protein
MVWLNVVAHVALNPSLYRRPDNPFPPSLNPQIWIKVKLPDKQISQVKDDS